MGRVSTDTQYSNIGSCSHVFRVREAISPVSPLEVERICRMRRKRLEHFPQGLFADPAWDMLLHLYSIELSGARTSITGVIRAACVPYTTGLRWLGTLIDAELCQKDQDLADARRQFVSLTERGRRAMDEYFLAHRNATGSAPFAHAA